MGEIPIYVFYYIRLATLWQIKILHEEDSHLVASDSVCRAEAICIAAGGDAIVIKLFDEISAEGTNNYVIKNAGGCWRYKGSAVFGTNQEDRHFSA